MTDLKAVGFCFCFVCIHVHLHMYLCVCVEFMNSIIPVFIVIILPGYSSETATDQSANRLEQHQAGWS